METSGTVNPVRPLRAGPWPWLLIAAGAVTYANSLGGPFIWDDDSWAYPGAHIQQLWPPRWFDSALPNSVTNGRPLVALTYALNYAAGGLDVRGFHVVNVTLHIVASLVLFGVIRRTLCRESLRARFAPSARTLAGVTALLWLVHPLLTESVVYLSQRTVLMMGLFYLLTLYCAIRADERGRSGLWSVAAVVCCLLGAASKQVIVTAPAMVVMYDWAFRSKPFSSVLRRRWPLYVGLSTTWIVLGALMAAFPDVNIGMGNEVGPWQYALNQCVIIVDYLRLALWPHPLVLDYGCPAPLSVAQAAPQGFLLLGLLVAALWLFVRKPALGYAGAWFFVTLSPTSSFVPIAMEVGAERRMYLPLIGLVFLAVLGAYLLLRSVIDRETLRRRVAVSTVATLAIVLACVSFRRNRDYRDEVSVWRSAVAAAPDNPRTYSNLGLSLVKAEKSSEALDCYNEALRIDPEFAKARNNLGLLLMSQGRREEAIAQYRRAIETWPNFSEARVNLGNALAKQGRIAEAITQYRRAIKPRPDIAEAHSALGAALVMTGVFDEGVAEIREAIRLSPQNADYHYNLGTALASHGDVTPAVESFNRAVKLAPDSFKAHYSLGMLYVQTGRSKLGLEHLRRAAQLVPDRPEPLEALARVLATNPDPGVRNSAEAVRLAEQAIRMAGRPEPRLLDTLAAAYAADGNFERAVETARRAADLAQRGGAGRLASEIRQRAALYERREIYVERAQPAAP